MKPCARARRVVSTFGAPRMCVCHAKKISRLGRAASGILSTHLHKDNIMSALLASSFVGRVAAFKATKVQVRL